MVFTAPAPMVFPNRSGWAPGTEMDLWSINPITGEFDDVGDMVVSDDGLSILTTSGGVRNSSWHLPVIRDPEVKDDTKQPECGCEKSSVIFTSNVELGTGTLLEQHTTATYQSLGATRGATLVYDSIRANPSSTVRFSYENVDARLLQSTEESTPLLLGRLDIQTDTDGSFRMASERNLGLLGGEHLWSIDESFSGSRFGGAISVDLSDHATGVLGYSLDTGIFRSSALGDLSGATSNLEGRMINVNSQDSSFGSGWGLAGLQEIVEHEQFEDVVLLVDDDGTESMFIVPFGPGLAYQSPPGDFSRLEKIDDLFRRTLKDGTVYQFNSDNKLESVTDRNGNQSLYEYDVAGNISRMTDPAGLVTNFNYAGGMLNEIVNPNGATTTLEHDSAGNLMKITDTDGSARSFDYDSRSLLTREIDKRGNSEIVEYDDDGRATSGIRADGTQVLVQSAESLGSTRLSGANNSVDPPKAESRLENRAVFVDGNGETTEYNLGASFLIEQAQDELGQLYSLTRSSSSNLPVSIVDGNGNLVELEYDANGNVQSESDSFTSVPEPPVINFTPFGPPLGTGDTPVELAAGDFNADGQTDLVVANFRSENVSVFYGTGDGNFTAGELVQVGGNPEELIVADLNDDGGDDLVVHNNEGVSVLYGEFGGTLGGLRVYTVDTLFGTTTSVALDDFNEDGLLDIIAGIQFGGINLWLGKTDGTFGAGNITVAGGLEPVRIDSGDFNQDGFADIVFNHGAFATGDPSGFTVSLGNGDGTFRFDANSRYDTFGFGVPIVVEDFNKDGIDDVIAEGGSLFFYAGVGDGTFRTQSLISTRDPSPFSTPTNIGFLSTGNLDNDDNLDLVYGTATDSRLFHMLGNGDGTFSRPNSIGLDDPISGLVQADFNSDGVLDVAIGQAVDNTAIILISEFEPTELDVKPRISSYDFLFNSPTSTTDELGRRTDFQIDAANGNTLSVSRPEGQTTSFTYTEDGQVETITDALGRITQYQYNELGQTLTVTFARGTSDQGIQRHEYDDAGNQTAFTDENGNRTEFEYDDLNRLELTRDPIRNTTRFEYDDSGNLIQTTDARGNVTLNEFDARNRLIKTTAAGGETSVFEYDNEGNLIRSVDPLGNATVNQFDSRDRLLLTIDADGGRTTFTYDGNDNLISLTDPVGNRTRFAYDARDRLVRETDPLGAETVYQYDAIDNLISKTDRNERVTEFAYDDLDRLFKETWVGGNNVIDYSYDVVNNLVSVTDNFSSLTHAYDQRNRVKTVDNTGTPDAPNVILEYGYDGVGNVTSVADTINGEVGGTTSYAYDALNRATTIQQTGDGVSDKLVDFVYNELGQFDEINRYSDLTRTNLVASSDYNYDELNRLERLAHLNDARDAIAFYDFTFDDSSRITSINDVDGLTEYSYDDRDQITGANRDDGDLRGSESYSYDANGNRLDSHLHGNGYQTGAANRLLSDGKFSYEYDDEGNQINRREVATGNTREFTWDNRNRLTAFSDSNAIGVLQQVIRYTYDSFGRRIRKSVDSTPNDTLGSAIEHFVYDRNDVILDFTGTEGTDPEALRQDIRYLRGPGIDNLLAIESPSETNWVLQDQLGSTRAIASASSVLVETIEYDSFGTTILDGLPSTRYLFTGREFDAESGLLYYRARYYDASNGRFTSEDPIGFLGGDMNLAQYVFNDPIARTDALGLWSPVAHDVGFDYSFNQRLSGNDRSILKNASRYLDRKTGMDPIMSHMHSMARKGQSPADAIGQRNNFIARSLAEARELNQSGDRAGALRRFGEACHTLMDSTSPMHTDSSGRPLTWNPWSPWGHSPIEPIPLWPFGPHNHLKIGNETAKDLTPAILNQQKYLLNKAYDYVFIE